MGQTVRWIPNKPPQPHRLRLSNSVIQFLLGLLNLYIIFFDEVSRADIVNGYSLIGDVNVSLFATYYVIDIVLFLQHPRKSLQWRIGWCIHHLLAISLIYGIMKIQRGSFVGACFGISATSHLPNNIRWFIGKCHVKQSLAYKICGLIFLSFFFVTCIFPIPYLFWILAEQNQISLYEAVFHTLARICVVSTLLVFIPHVIIFIVIVMREIQSWGLPPKKVE